jgi:hypothetical protein
MKPINWHFVWRYVSRAAIAMCGIAATIFVIALLPNLIETTKRQQIARAYADSVFSYSFYSYSCSGNIGFKINEDGRNCRYKCLLTADSGFCFDTGTYGKLFIKLLDKDNFVLDELEISSFVNIKDPSREEILVRTADGTAYVGLRELIRTNTVVAPTTLKLVRLSGETEEKDRSKTFLPKSEFDEKMEEWTKKTQRIKIGMTYDEMIMIAGKPRVSSTIDQDEIRAGYDFNKYNYGRKWVLFKNGLVCKIK